MSRYVFSKKIPSRGFLKTYMSLSNNSIQYVLFIVIYRTKILYHAVSMLCHTYLADGMILRYTTPCEEKLERRYCDRNNYQYHCGIFLHIILSHAKTSRNS